MKEIKDVLVIVDMVNGFVNFGNLADKRINAIVPKIEKMVQKAINKKMPIIAFKDCHKVNDEEFKTFPPHCIKGTAESELVPQLLPYEKFMIVIEKQTTNGFKTKGFADILENYKFDNIHVCGCCTDICVEAFCLSLKKYLQRNEINTNVLVYENAVSTFDSPTHNAIETHNQALSEMQKAGIKIIKSKENTNETTY